jgi:hypothetical protein
MSAKLYQELGFQASKSQGRIVPAKFLVLFPVGRDFRCRDRFDSDCVRHHAVPYKQKFPDAMRIAPNWWVFVRGLCLC